MTTGLIAAALEQELLGELRRHGIVVWLDATKAYTPFVDGLADRAIRTASRSRWSRSGGASSS